MSQRNSDLKAFNAISEFVGDLVEVFGSEDERSETNELDKNLISELKPLFLYNRLIEKTTIRDFQSISRHISAFKSFFTENPKFVISLTGNPKIVYSEKIYIDISTVLSRMGTKDEKKAVYKHLLTIFSLVNLGSEESKAAINELKGSVASTGTISVSMGENEKPISLPNSNEGKFITETLGKLQNQIGDTTQIDNPAAMAMNLMNTGFFTEFMSDLQTKFSSGEMDIKNLIGTITNVISETSGGEGVDGNKDIQNMMNSVLNTAGLAAQPRSE